MGAEIIRRDVDEFQATVKTLSDSIKSAGSLWKDSKYNRLASSVSNIARDSRDVVLAGDRCCSAIDRFDVIAAEEY